MKPHRDYDRDPLSAAETLDLLDELAEVQGSHRHAKRAAAALAGLAFGLLVHILGVTEA